MAKLVVKKGEVYGKLTIQKEVAPTGKNKERRFQCLCECGRLKDVDLAALRKGNVRSCGCIKTEGMRVAAKKGDVYGRYTLLREVKGSKPRKFVCECECGAVKEAYLHQLRAGTTVSCGCFRLDKIRLAFSVGEKVNRLTIVEDLGIVNNKAMVRCECECGNFKTALYSEVKAGKVKSCGCASFTHGLTEHRLYHTYLGMLRRCYNTKDRGFQNYGGRGITVCKSWRNPDSGLQNFISWADNLPSSLAWKEGFEIDRIDNEKGYYPANCHFVPKVDNVRNRRVTLWVDIPEEITDKELRPLFDYEEKHKCKLFRKNYTQMLFVDLFELRGAKGLPYKVAANRLNAPHMKGKWTPLEAVTTPRLRTYKPRARS
jgi:hypothetical protein